MEMSRHRIPPPCAIACALALLALPARPQASRDSWARLDAPAALTAARGIAASEAPGDAFVSPLSVDDGMLSVQGTFRLDKGSRWSSLGVEIGPTASGATEDMSAASVLRIRLAAADARPLRVRIKGDDRDIAGAGCYPVVMQMVTPVPTDYVIPLSAFRPPGWCGFKAATIEQTLHSVQRVEVTANDGPAGPVRFSVGQVDFLADDWNEPDEAWHLAWQDDFDGERGRAPGAAWQSDGAPGHGLALDGAGHLRLRAGRGAGAGSGDIAIRSASDRPITQGRVEVRLRVPEAMASGRPARVRIALHAPSASVPALVLLEGDAGAKGLSAGLDLGGPNDISSDLRSPVMKPLANHFVTVTCDREPGRVRWLVDGAIVKEAGRDDFTPAAWAALESTPLGLDIAVEGPGESTEDGRSDLLVDRVRFWRRPSARAPSDPAASRAMPKAGLTASPAATAAIPARRRPSATAPAAAPSAPATSHRVVCEHSTRYELTLCH